MSHYLPHFCFLAKTNICNSWLINACFCPPKQKFSNDSGHFIPVFQNPELSSVHRCPQILMNELGVCRRNTSLRATWAKVWRIRKGHTTKGLVKSPGETCQGVWDLPGCVKSSGMKTRKLLCINIVQGVSRVVLEVTNLPASARDMRDSGSTPGSGRSPGESHGNPL